MRGGQNRDRCASPEVSQRRTTTATARWVRTVHPALVGGFGAHLTCEPRNCARLCAALTLRAWVAAVGAKTACIEPGGPWENGCCESFNSKLRDELLTGEAFFSLAEAQVLIEAWRCHYNTDRPHSSLGHRPPAPETIVPRSGSIAPWASAPAVGAARSPTPIGLRGVRSRS
jgi:hypothetical protein